MLICIWLSDETIYIMIQMHVDLYTVERRSSLYYNDSIISLYAWSTDKRIMLECFYFVKCMVEQMHGWMTNNLYYNDSTIKCMLNCMVDELLREPSILR